MPQGVSVAGQAQGTNQPSPPAGVVMAQNEVKLVVQSNQFEPFPDFGRGTWPTLLDSKEAKKVKRFIENFSVNFTGRLKTGSPPTSKFEWIFAPNGQDLEIWIPTDLITDPRPTLANHLNVERFKIISRTRDLHLLATQGHAVFVEGGEQLSGTIKLGSQGVNNYVGLKAPSGANNVVWTLPASDGSANQVLETNGAGVLAWADSGTGYKWGVIGDNTSTGANVRNDEFVDFTGGNLITTDLTEDSSLTGYYVTINHDTSAVSAGTYGSSTQVPVITIDAYGHITSATNTTITGGGGGMTSWIIEDDYLDTVTVTNGQTLGVYGGTYITTDLNASNNMVISHADSGVTAGTYGSATQVAQVTLDDQGHITSCSNVTITGGGGSSMTFDFAHGSDSFTVSNGDTITFSSSDGSVSFDLSTPDYIDITASGGGSSYSWDVTADSGGPDTISSGMEVKVLGGYGPMATRTSTISGGTTYEELSIDHNTSGVTAGTYGSSTQSAVITVDDYGHITSATTATIAGGGSSYYWIIADAAGNTQNIGTTAGVRVDFRDGNGTDVALYGSGSGYFNPTLVYSIDDTVAQHIYLTSNGGTTSGQSSIDFDDHASSNAFGLVAGSNVTLTGNTNGTIEIASAGGGSSSFDFAHGSDSFTVSNGDTVTFSSSDGSVSFDLSTADNIDITAAGGGGGGGSLNFEGDDGLNTGTITLSSETFDLNGSSTQSSSAPFIVTDVPSSGGEQITFTVGRHVCTEIQTGSNGGSVTGDSTVICGHASGASTGAFVIASGNGIVVDGTNWISRITISQTYDSYGNKTAIVKDSTDDEDSYVELYCTESPEVRFEDVVTINTDGLSECSHEIDHEFVHVCEPDSIQAVGHTTSEPAVAGIKINGNMIEVKFADILPVPEQLVVHIMGIRSGRDGLRFKKSDKEKADWNSKFWSLPHAAVSGYEPRLISKPLAEVIKEQEIKKKEEQDNGNQ